MKDREKMQALLDGHTLRSGTTLFRLSEGGVLLRLEPGDECWEDHGDFSALHITDDIVIADGFTLTFSEAMGKVAAGETVTSLYDCSISYCIVRSRSPRRAGATPWSTSRKRPWTPSGP